MNAFDTMLITANIIGSLICLIFLVILVIAIWWGDN